MTKNGTPTAHRGKEYISDINEVKTSVSRSIRTELAQFGVLYSVVKSNCNIATMDTDRIHCISCI